MKKSLLEKFFSAPALVLEKSVEIGQEIKEDIKQEEPVKKAASYWKILGPGLVAGGADDDPSGIATYSQVGAQTGFGLIWLSLFSFPLMGVVQEMCARIGLATGVGLSANIRKSYSRKVLLFCVALLFFTNIFNIGADLGAMAQATQLLFPKFSFTLLVVVFSLFCLYLQVFFSYKKYATYLKYLSLILFAYVFSAFSIDISWGEVFRNLIVPHFSFSKDMIILICAVLGTTISPYLFFWQSSQEVEEQILHGEKTVEARRNMTTKKDITNMRIDVWSGMFVSNAVMFFIIASCAAVLYTNGITTIATASDAAIALKPFAGNFTYLLFTIGILGTGLLAIPVLAGSASYAIGEAFGWKTGLYRTLKQGTSFYGVIMVAMLLGVGMNFIGLDPIKALIYSAVLNGIISPIILLLIVQISSNAEIMGEFKNSKLANFLGWLTTSIMFVVGILALYFILV